MPESTTAAVIDRFGGPEELHLAEVPLSPPGPGELRLRVLATALNPVDLLTRAGAKHLVTEDRAWWPMVLGWDVAGEVEAVGDGVEGWTVGDRALAMTYQPMTRAGSYAEHVVLEASTVGPWLGDVAPEVAAGLPLAGLTAVQALDAVGAATGETLLVNAPLGGVGSLLVQLAARRGVRVVGVARPADADRLAALGAAATVDRDGDVAAAVRDTVGAVDTAIDLVGGAAAGAALAAVRDGGRYASAVPLAQVAGGPEASERDVAVAHRFVQQDAAGLAELARLLAAGELTIEVAETFGLGDAARAHATAERGGVRGRLVLLPG